MTISGLKRKQTSTILEFYFQFRVWPDDYIRQVSLHQAAKFRPNQSILSGDNDVISILKIAAAAAQFYLRFQIVWGGVGPCLSANQIL